MKKIFDVGDGFDVPDGTIVHSIMDPQLLRRDGPRMVGDMSLALGEIPPGITSKIHVHPVVSQLTFVISGRLKVRMKDASNEEPYALNLGPEQSVMTEAGTFFQLINDSDENCRALYVVTPSFIFECDSAGRVLYNDAMVLDEDWDRLARISWMPAKLKDLSKIRRDRENAWGRFVKSKHV